MHRPKSKLAKVTADENTKTPLKRTATRLYGSATTDTLTKLVKPFKCPGSAPQTRQLAIPARKKRKVSYKGQDGNGSDDGEFVKEGEEKRIPLGNLEKNKAFPVFKAKDKETMFRQRFAVPLIDKNTGGYDSQRPSPALGMRKRAGFIARPLHDPSGEFAIVLYDPTVDDKKVEITEENGEVKIEVVSKIHRSLADILGLSKDAKEEIPKVPVVIDPRLAKVLRPHQVEGVKVCFLSDSVSRIEADIHPVSIQMYHWNGRSQGKRLYHGRRNGSR